MELGRVIKMAREENTSPSQIKFSGKRKQMRAFRRWLIAYTTYYNMKGSNTDYNFPGKLDFR